MSRKQRIKVKRTPIHRISQNLCVVVLIDVDLLMFMISYYSTVIITNGTVVNVVVHD